MACSVGTRCLYAPLLRVWGYAIDKTFTPMSRPQGDRTSYVHITLSLSFFSLDLSFLPFTFPRSPRFHSVCTLGPPRARLATPTTERSTCRPRRRHSVLSCVGVHRYEYIVLHCYHERHENAFHVISNGAAVHRDQFLLSSFFSRLFSPL